MPVVEDVAEVLEAEDREWEWQLAGRVLTLRAEIVASADVVVTGSETV